MRLHYQQLPVVFVLRGISRGMLLKFFIRQQSDLFTIIFKSLTRQEMMDVL